MPPVHLGQTLVTRIIEVSEDTESYVGKNIIGVVRFDPSDSPELKLAIDRRIQSRVGFVTQKESLEPPVSPRTDALKKEWCGDLQLDKKES